MSEPDNVIPLKRPANDVRPPRPPRAVNIPPVTGALCLLIVAMYAAMVWVLPSAWAERLALLLQFVPSQSAADPIGRLPSLLGYALLHMGSTHLLVNVTMLLSVGSAIERFMGGRYVLMTCIAGTIAGAVTQMAVTWGSGDPMVGASAAVSGLFGVYTMLQPTQDLRRKMAIAMIGLFLATAAIYWLMVEGSAIAWAAHLGGYAVGMALGSVWLKRKL